METLTRKISVIFQLESCGWLALLVLACLVSPASAQNGMPSLQLDKQIGVQTEREILQDSQNYPLLSPREHPQVYTYLDEIKRKLLSSGKIQHAEDFPWQVHIVDDPQTVNAFASPGGYLYVYTGLILYADNEAQLAGVLAHEMAHADLRHAVQSLGFENAPRRRTARWRPMWRQLQSLRFSRRQEFEADEYSVIYLSATDYHAPSVLHFLEKMASEESSFYPQFLSSHPNDYQRLALMASTLQSLEHPGAVLGESRHREVVESLQHR